MYISCPEACVVRWSCCRLHLTMFFKWKVQKIPQGLSWYLLLSTNTLQDPMTDRWDQTSGFSRGALCLSPQDLRFTLCVPAHIPTHPPSWHSAAPRARVGGVWNFSVCWGRLTSSMEPWASATPPPPHISPDFSLPRLQPSSPPLWPPP